MSMACSTCPAAIAKPRPKPSLAFPTTLRITVSSDEEAAEFVRQNPTYSVSRRALGPQAILLIASPK